MIRKNFKTILIALLILLNILFIGVQYKIDSDTSENARKDTIVIDRIKNDALDVLNEIEKAKNDTIKNASESKSASDTTIEFARETEVSGQNAQQDASVVEAATNEIIALKNKQICHKRMNK